MTCLILFLLAESIPKYCFLSPTMLYPLKYARRAPRSLVQHNRERIRRGRLAKALHGIIDGDDDDDDDDEMVSVAVMNMAGNNMAGSIPV